MTDSMKYLWLLLREDSSYIFMLMLIVGSAVIVSAFFQRASVCNTLLPLPYFLPVHCFEPEV